MTVSTWAVYCNCIVTCLCSLLFLFKAYAHSYRLDETNPQSPAPAQSLGALSDETLVIAPRERERERERERGPGLSRPTSLIMSWSHPTPLWGLGSNKCVIIDQYVIRTGISTSCSVTCPDTQSDTSQDFLLVLKKGNIALSCQKVKC